MKISKKAFNRIKEHDYVVFKSGEVRRVLSITRSYNSSYLTFEKLSKEGTTCYLYGDLNKKIIGRFKTKTI